MHGAADMDWLRRMGALTVERDGDEPAGEFADGPADEVRSARRRVGRLCAAAVAVAASPEARGACPPAAARLVTELARAGAPAIAPRPAGSAPPVLLVREYLDALCQAATAVYFCRRVEHASHRCWFSPLGPTADLCGRVLDAGHRCAATG